jgi:DNA-binding CsgD family transcriptional regulator
MKAHREREAPRASSAGKISIKDKGLSMVEACVGGADNEFTQAVRLSGGAGQNPKWQLRVEIYPGNVLIYRRRRPVPMLTIGTASLTDALRPTGIDLVGALPWGAHLCLFYETKEDLLNAAVSYLKAGLESKEFCLWAVPEPLTEDEVIQALSRAVPAFDRYLADRSIEIFPAREWYLDEGQLDLKSIVGRWHEKLRGALSRGYEGMRVSGDAVWVATKPWQEFSSYEQEVDEFLTGHLMTALCTYSLTMSRAVDVLNVARIHQFTMALRKGVWAVVETNEFETGKSLERLSEAGLVASHGAKLATLTARERAVFEKILAGASSKEAARRLGISPRTVDFHRANILQKLGAKNTADLLRIALSE